MRCKKLNTKLSTPSKAYRTKNMYFSRSFVGGELKPLAVRGVLKPLASQSYQWYSAAFFPPLFKKGAKQGGKAEHPQNPQILDHFGQGLAKKKLQNFRSPSAAKSQRSETRGEAAEYH